MSGRHLAILLTVSGLILSGFAFPSYGQESCQLLGSAVIVGVNSVRTGTDVVIGGDVVVNLPPAGPTLGNGFSLYIDRKTSITGAIKADRIRIFNQAAISGSATFNQITNDGQISGGQFSPLSLPVFSPLPTFQEAVLHSTPQNVSVGPGATTVLTPGEYGDITVADTGKIIFTGGVYHIRSIDATGDGTSFTFNTASEVRIHDKFRTRRNATIGPATGSGLSAVNIVFYVGGINGTNGQLDSTPEAARVGSGTVVTANFYVPNGTMRLETDVVATGAFLARDVQVDSRSHLTLATVFVNRAPTATAQDVFTNGLEPPVITLRASDPDSRDLTFAIAGGLQFSSRGSLGAVVNGPASFPGNPPGCNPDNNPSCIPPDTPRTTATVTYTPNTAGNEENSFTFSAADACGNIGMAPVRINPAGDTTTPPVATVVDATNVLVETATNTPRDVTLVAGAPPTATLTFSIESLPAHGSLKDGNGASIGSVPYTLPTRKVTYTPTSAFTGSDTFLFKATGTVGGSDTASVVVNVAALPELAQNQNVTTNVNTPIEITLQGNSGGTGTPADQFATRTMTQADVFTGSTVAGNVSDANGDGLGDGRDDLPGPAPVLIAAGVDVNLGSPASGSVTDPDNDASPSSNPPPGPDLISATVISDGPNIILQVRFKAGTFDSQLTRAQFILDTDRNPATGHPGSDSGCSNDNGIIGAEFLVDLGADLGTTAQVLQYQGTCNSFAAAGSGTTTFVTDGMDATVPRSLLGNTDGRLNFKVVTSELLSPGPGFTGVLDYMPDVGLPAGQLRAGIRGVARIEIEWNVSALPGAEGIENAEVTLNTLKGTVDSLDTFFFAGTAEQDGVLAIADFQAPATAISGAVMPVPAVATGTEGTFVFNVTNQLRAARAAGRNFFSIKGRVDEGLAGGGFQRGLQIRSTADSNLSAGKEPKLQVVTTAVGSDLTFKITSLPVNGILRFGGVPVVVNQTFSSSPTLLYTPTLNFTGTDSFGFQVTQGAFADLATVSIVINFVAGNCEFNGRPVGCAAN